MPHIHEKIDFCADTFIVYKNTVLLRMHEKYHEWFPPGGHIELDEDPATAAIRESKEEVGLDVTLMDTRLFTEPFIDKSIEIIPPMGLNRHRINENHEHISLFYFATTLSNKIVQGDTELSDNIKWFTEDDLLDPKLIINPRVKAYALKALEMLSSKSAT